MKALLIGAPVVLALTLAACKRPASGGASSSSSSGASVPAATATTTTKATPTDDAAKHEAAKEETAPANAEAGAEASNRRQLSDAMRVAKIAFNKRDIAVALKALNKVPEMLTADPEYLGLRGACYVEKRDYERALKDFEKAATLKPGDPSIQFNIAEVYFVTKRWDEAIKAFQLLKPKPGRDGDALQALVEFKLMLCEEGRGNAGEFERRAEKNLKDPDSLLGIHTRAAMEYRAGKTDDAKRTAASAAAIFTEPLDRAPWYDTLVEFGYDIR